ncbi:MAG: FtsX-like permease family protein, partial [Clostridiales bacterium]|nr:FtsX-like permease family protein [Clostridiales bacterium]
IGIPVMVFLGSLIATTSYKKLTVLEALRSGITSHNFRKNHFPLEKSRLPLNLVMAGKNNMGSVKRSIFITLIVALLTMSTCEGFSMFQNWALDQSNILNMIGLEISDIQVPTYGDDALENEARKHGDVEKVNTWTTIQSAEVTYLENSESLGIDVYGDVNILNQETVIEGHLPANGNEIVLSVVESERLGAKPGDVVDIKAVDGSFVAFTVSGIDQKFNNMGKKGLMSEEGALRINPNFQPEYTIIYLKDSSKAKDLKDEWEDKYPDYQFILFETFMSESIDSIIMAMETICFVFVIATCFVVILTQLLLTRAQVIRERKNLGVSKALGYTSGELIRRTLMTNIPLIVIGILIGSAFHIAFSDKLTIIALASFGMREISASTDPVWFLVSALIIIVCAVVTALLSSRRIAKLEPSRILTEE